MSSSRRTQAREVALQALYQHDVAASTRTPIPHASELEPFLKQCSDDVKVVRYARDLVDGVLSIQKDLDSRITRVAANWKLNRIAAVDRCILRLALFELLEVDDVPPKVALNEAIELAKRFSTSRSGSFVNGVLDRAYREMVTEFGDKSNAEEDDQPEKR